MILAWLVRVSLLLWFWGSGPALRPELIFDCFPGKILALRLQDRAPFYCRRQLSSNLKCHQRQQLKIVWFVASLNDSFQGTPEPALHTVSNSDYCALVFAQASV